MLAARPVLCPGLGRGGEGPDRVCASTNHSPTLGWETHKSHGVLVEHEVSTDGVLKGFQHEVWGWEVGEALSQVHDIILTGQFSELQPGQQRRVVTVHLFTLTWTSACFQYRVSNALGLF